MLFRRRHKPHFGERVRIFLWPRRGWRRSTQYVAKRVLRLSGSPHAIALGFAAGVFASFTPFVGLHFIIGFLVAWVTGGNMVASALGTFVGNPLTFPFIWAATFELGNWVLGRTPQAALRFDETRSVLNESIDVLLPLIKPMTVAGVPLGIIAAIAFYFPVRMIIDAYQQRRRKRLRGRLVAEGEAGAQ